MDPTSETDADFTALARQQEVVAELGRRAVETSELDELLRDASVAVAETLGVDYGSVLEVRSGGAECLLRHGAGWPDELVGDGTVSTGEETIVGATLEASSIAVDDVRTDHRISQALPFADQDIRSGVSVVIGSPDDPWGVLGAHATAQRTFAEHDVTFLQHVSNILAAAIDTHQRTSRTETETQEMDRIIETSPVGIVIVGSDGTLEFANDRAEEIYGRSEAEIASYSHDDPRWDLVDAHGTPMAAEELPFKQVMAAGEPVSDVELGLRQPDGRRVWVSVNGAPMRSETGKIERVIFAFTDVTEKKHLEGEFEEILTRITDAFYGLDEEFRFTHVNDRAETLLQHTEAELLGERLWDVFPSAADIDAVWDAFHTARETNEQTSYELYYDDLDFWVEATIYPSDTGLSVYFRDVTERKIRERQLKESEQRHRTLAENFPNGIVTMFDGDLRYTLAAGRAFADLPVDASDLEGRHVRDAWPDETGEVLESAFRAALDGERQVIEIGYVGREWVIRIVPLVDGDGSVFGGITIAQDITERNERERELERALDLLEKTQRIADVGGWEIVVETKEVFWTDHIFELLDVPGDDEPPLDEALDMYHEADKVRLETAIETALDTGDPFDEEVRIRTLGDAERWLRLRGVPGTNDDGDVVLRGAVHDITEHKGRERRLEEVVEKLEESNRRLEQFAYAASHDLQEPLRMITSYLRLIEDRYGDALDSDGEDFIEFAVGGAERMREMIDGLLQYSRVETEGNPLDTVDLNDVLAETREDLRVRIEESDASITAESLPRVTGDASQLRQVFQNLLTNAIEYSGAEPPRIRVTSARDESMWRISVADDGIGIDPAYQDQIFDVFNRLHDSTTHTGTGIGLALCERIVERHGGDIWVESEPGAGSTFHFTVPRADPNA